MSVAAGYILPYSTDVPYRVVVADDHPLYRSALAELIGRNADFVLVAAVDSLHAVLTTLAHGPCDLAVLDLRMPGMDGVAGIKKLRERWPEVKIALISGDLEADVVRLAIAEGAGGVLPKTFDTDVLTAALRLVLAGATYVPHEMQAGATSAPSVRNPATHNLTTRELEILQHMAYGEAHKEIARALEIAEVTVKLHTQRIVRKMGVKNRTVAVAKAIKEGLISPPT